MDGSEDDIDDWELESLPEAPTPEAHPFASNACPQPPELVIGADDFVDTLPASPSTQSRPAQPRPLSPDFDFAFSDVIEPVRTRTRRGKKRKSSAQDQSREKQRAKKRKADAQRKRKHRQNEDARYYVPSAHALKKIEEVQTLVTDFDTANLSAAKGGYVGINLGVDPVAPELEALLAQGFRLFEWDGR